MSNIIHLDSLSLILSLNVCFVGTLVAIFSSRYLKGDNKMVRFYAYLFMLVLFMLIALTADHLLVFLIAFASSNFCLTRLMSHKVNWQAARYSSHLALQNYILGLVFLSCAFLCFYHTSHQTSIHILLTELPNTVWTMIGLSLLLLAAMAQSALWPFHRWLISSLNTPTPVSALMHAGLINGGGFLLARFSPLLLKQDIFLNCIFILGIFTAVVGTLWKLMQSDIKRMLACSTMGQMGFMFAQCGLGLFPAAIAHLCWHGLFKAYLFLSSGSAAQEKRLTLDYPPRIVHFLTALLCGSVGAFGFALITEKTFFSGDTTVFLLLISLIGGAQFALPLIQRDIKRQIPIIFLATFIMGIFYGISVHMIEVMLLSENISQALPLNSLHILAILVLSLCWLALVFRKSLQNKDSLNYWKGFYVRALNASQPHPATITAHHNHYQF